MDRWWAKDAMFAKTWSFFRPFFLCPIILCSIFLFCVLGREKIFGTAPGKSRHLQCSSAGDLHSPLFGDFVDSWFPHGMHSRHYLGRSHCHAPSHACTQTFVCLGSHIHTRGFFDCVLQKKCSPLAKWTQLADGTFCSSGIITQF